METPFWRDLPQDQFDAVNADVEAPVPLRRLGTIDEVASAYVHRMSNGFITGQMLAVDGGVMP